jgi:transcriptional regulator of acetoin/glycerol metabolism
VRVEHLPAKISGKEPAAAASGIGEIGIVPANLKELKDSKRRLKERVYEQVDRAFALGALERAGWNITQAAALVGMQRTNFHALMRKYGIRKINHN